MVSYIAQNWILLLQMPEIIKLIKSRSNLI